MFQSKTWQKIWFSNLINLTNPTDNQKQPSSCFSALNQIYKPEQD